MMTQGFPSNLVGSPQEFVCNSWMFEECSPPIPFSSLLGHSGFGDAVWSVEAAASYDIQEITFLGGCLIWNDAAVCCGMIWLKCLLVSSLTYGTPLRGKLWWFFLFPKCVVSVGMYNYWQVSIQASVLLNRGIMRSLGQRMPCASSQVHWNCLWMPICITPVPFAWW